MKWDTALRGDIAHWTLNCHYWQFPFHTPIANLLVGVTTMLKRAVLLFVIFIIAGGLMRGDGRGQAELRFAPAGNAERNAGVWVDGHYVGYVNEFNSDHKLMLLPGTHIIVVRQAWYQEHVEELLVEPGIVYKVKLSMVKESRIATPPATAELKISATPSRAAVFVDDQFAGHSDEFGGAGRAMLVTSGQHKVSIALPGYVPFEVVLNVRPYQKLKIETKLQKGSITEAGPLVSPE